MSEKTICEFCGKEEICASTTFVGMYCIDCLRTVMCETREAIKEIKEEKKDEGD